MMSSKIPLRPASLREKLSELSDRTFMLRHFLSKRIGQLKTVTIADLPDLLF